MKKVLSKKTIKLAVISDKIKNLKSTLDYIVFDALTDGELIVNNKTAEELELSKRDIRKSTIRLVKKGYVNVYEGRFCLSKKGRKEVKFNYKKQKK